MNKELRKTQVTNRDTDKIVPLSCFPVEWSGTGHEEIILGVCELKDGRLLSWSHDKTLRLWSHDGKELSVLTEHNFFIKGAFQLSDGRLLSWSWDGTLRLWSSEGKSLHIFGKHELGGVLELSNGQLLSWGNNCNLNIWSNLGELSKVLKGHKNSLIGACELSDGRILSWDSHGTFIIWSNEGKEIQRITEQDSYLSLNFDLNAFELSDGRILSWSWGGPIKIWSSQVYKLKEIKKNRLFIHGVCQISDGKILSWDNKTLQIWSSEGELLREIISKKHSIRGVIELSNRQLLLWSWDGTLQLWNTDWEELRVIEGHNFEVNGACELSDRRLLSWSSDKTIRMWSTEGELLKVLSSLPNRTNPHLDIDFEFSLLFNQAGSVTRGYGYNSNKTINWYKHHSSGVAVFRTLKPHPDPKIAASVIDRNIKRYVNTGTCIYLSLRSAWATELFLHLDQNLFPYIRGIQCFNVSEYANIAGILPKLELDLLQLSYFHSTEKIDTLYGIRAHRLLVFRCNHLCHLEGNNCQIKNVEFVECPNLDFVHVSERDGNVV